MVASKLISKYNGMSQQVKASIWYTFSNVLVKSVALLTTPVFARLMSKEEYGTFTVFQSWFNIIFIFSTLNMFMSGYTKGLLLYKGKEKEFTSSLLGLSTVITFILLGVYCVNMSFWSGVLELQPHLVIALFMELLLMPAYDLWAARKRFDYEYTQFVAVSVVMSISGLLIGVFAVIISKHNVEARVYADVFSKCVISLVLFILIFTGGKSFFNKEFWKYTLRFNLPLIPHYLSNYVLNQSDRLMIAKMVGKEEAATYSIAYTISTMMNLVVTAINNAVTPYLYKSINSNDTKDIKKITRPIFLLIAVLCVLTMILAPEIIYVFAGKAYMEAIYVIPPISLSVYCVFVYAMYSSIEYYHQKTMLISIATSASALVNLLLNYVFIKMFGYMAAGYTTLVCYAALAVLHYLFYKRVLKECMDNSPSLYDDRLILIIGTALVGIMIILLFVYQWIIIRYGILLIIAIICFFNRKKIINSLILLKK